MKIRTPRTQALRPVENAGFTLIETIVGMVVTGTVAFSVYAGLNLGFVLVQTARENQRATQILVEKMEVIRLCNYDQITTPGYLPASFTAYFYEGTTSTNGPAYTGTLTIAPTGMPVNYSNDVRLVTFTVSWQTKSIQCSRTLSTLASRNGIQSYVCN